MKLNVSVSFTPGLTVEEVRKLAMQDDPKIDWLSFIAEDRQRLAELVKLIEKRIDINNSKAQVSMEMNNDSSFSNACGRVSILNEILGSLLDYR